MATEVPLDDLRGCRICGHGRAPGERYDPGQECPYRLLAIDANAQAQRARDSEWRRLRSLEGATA